MIRQILKWLRSFIGNKIIYYTLIINYVLNTQKIDDKVVKSEKENLSCFLHEKSDTKIIFYIYKVERDSNIVIRCSDIDILVIMLGNMQIFELKC